MQTDRCHFQFYARCAEAAGYANHFRRDDEGAITPYSPRLSISISFRVLNSDSRSALPACCLRIYTQSVGLCVEGAVRFP